MHLTPRGPSTRHCLFNHELSEGEVNVGIRHSHTDEKLEKKQFRHFLRSQESEVRGILHFQGNSWSKFES